MSSEIKEIFNDEIRNSDFYNKRLDSSSNPLKTKEGEILRVTDKMLDNIVKKVNRYWYEYGLPQKTATFFNPRLSYEDRAKFSFDNFFGDQLNVILSIIGLRPEDFSMR